MSDALTFDQVEVFLTIAGNGSFASAARTLRRSPSAITYLIQKMEEQLGVVLFDRSGYRPALTYAGRALLPRIRRVAEEMHGLRITAKGMSQGLEPDLTIAVDSLFPIDVVTNVLVHFQETFPTVQLRLFVETFGTATHMVRTGSASIGISSDFHPDDDELVIEPLLDITTIMVAAPHHPLARHGAPIDVDVLRDHVQVVVTDRSMPPESRDYAVHSARTWRVGDMQTKRNLLCHGLGFGTLPDHFAANDISLGRLSPLDINGLQAANNRIPIALVRKADKPIGRAAHWFIDQFARRAR